MYGLLGRKLSHSLSPQIHAHFGSYPYELFCREPEELDEFFKDKTLKAYNVTIPYKIDAYNHCDELSETAEKIGSVNTVIRRLSPHTTIFLISSPSRERLSCGWTAPVIESPIIAPHRGARKFTAS